MHDLTVTFGVPDSVREGLASGAYERVAGVIGFTTSESEQHPGGALRWLQETAALPDEPPRLAVGDSSAMTADGNQRRLSPAICDAGAGSPIDRNLVLHSQASGPAVGNQDSVAGDKGASFVSSADFLVQAWEFVVLGDEAASHNGEHQPGDSVMPHGSRKGSRR